MTTLSVVFEIDKIRDLSSETTRKNADRGCDQRPIWWVKIGSKLVRDERYLVCGSFDSTADLIPKIPRHGEVLDVMVLRVDLSADGNNLSIGLYQQSAYPGCAGE
jgi:hypothetical protein